MPPNLPHVVRESSGVVLRHGMIFTFGDSGNPPIFYGLDSATHAIKLTINLATTNTDWEDATQDENYFYIGDFGNNNGDRRDLHVLRIAKQGLPDTGSITVTPQRIDFSYPDQTSFASNGSNNFDCEAMLAYGDSLWLFSKNRGDRHCKWYTLPKAPGTYTAHLRASFNSQGLVTGAALHPTRDEVTLIGYTGINSFVWLLHGYDVAAGPLSGNRRQITLPLATTIGQTEGIAYADTGRVFITNERVKFGHDSVPQRLWEMPVWQYSLAARHRQTPAAISAKKKDAPYRLINENGAVYLENTAPLYIEEFDLVGRTLVQKELPTGQHILPYYNGVRLLHLRWGQGQAVEVVR